MKIPRERIDEITYWKSKRPYVRDLLIAIDERDELLAELRCHIADWHVCVVSTKACTKLAIILDLLRGSRFEVK